MITATVAQGVIASEGAGWASEAVGKFATNSNRTGNVLISGH